MMSAGDRPVAPDADEPELDRHEAERLVAEALRSVFAPEVIGQARDDSPLASLGMTGADAIAVAEALAAQAQVAGYTCLLGDAEFAEVTSVSDLVSAVVDHARKESS
jgi:hypothetical protein